MKLRRSLASRLAIAGIVGLTSFAMLGSAVDARVGSGRSFGSRGTKTFSAPPTTSTAPRAAQPVDRSITSPGASVSRPSAGAATGAAAQAVRSGGLLRGLLLGGFLGAGLAALFGTGMLAGLMGAILQIAWVAALIGLGVLAFRWFTGRKSQPATAMAGAGPQPRRGDDMLQRSAMDGTGSSVPPLKISEGDFNTFEQRLHEIQGAYSRGDEKGLGDRATPEMLSYFMQEIASNRSQGLRNELRDPKLLQGDLSEAWREGTMEYATVAMRFSVIDAMLDVSSGRVVSGSLEKPDEATEVWTFVRPANGRAQQWELSAIQQS